MVTGSALKRAIGAKSSLALYGRVLKRYGLAGRPAAAGGGKGETAGAGVAGWEEQGIAVGRGLGDVIAGQNGVGARPVLDEATLPERLAEVAGHQPRKAIAPGAGTGHRHDADRAHRVGLGHGLRVRQRKEDAKGGRGGGKGKGKGNKGTTRPEANDGMAHAVSVALQVGAGPAVPPGRRPSSARGCAAPALKAAATGAADRRLAGGAARLRDAEHRWMGIKGRPPRLRRGSSRRPSG